MSPSATAVARASPALTAAIQAADAAMVALPRQPGTGRQPGLPGQASGGHRLCVKGALIATDHMWLVLELE